MSEQQRQGFWHEAIRIQGTVTPLVMPMVLIYGLVSMVICGIVFLLERHYEMRISLAVTPHELAGAALSLLLVFRTNASYDRWWEARKLWGAFVDKSRNFAISTLVYGPVDTAWRESLVRWIASYPHIARHSLRGEPPAEEVVQLVGREQANRLKQADHMPVYVGYMLASYLRQACDSLGMDRFVFLQLDRERIRLIESYGGCERILNTPLPKAYSIKIRRFITFFLLTLPFAMLHRLGNDWLVPFITMVVAYPLLSLDQIGVELENPFAKTNVSHLPIDGIGATIERNLLALLQTPPHFDSHSYKATGETDRIKQETGANGDEFVPAEHSRQQS